MPWTRLDPLISDFFAAGIHPERGLHPPICDPTTAELFNRLAARLHHGASGPIAELLNAFAVTFGQEPQWWSRCRGGLHAGSGAV